MGTGEVSRWSSDAHAVRARAPKRRARARGAALAAVLLAVGSTTLASAAAPLAGTAAAFAAASTASSDGLAIDAGWAGAFDPTAPIPVRVTITADRLVRGTLVVEADGFVPNSLPIEVAGGSRKRIIVILPGSDFAGPVTIAAHVDGDSRLKAKSEIQSRGLAELVALMPGVRAGRPLPTTAALAYAAGSVRFSSLQDDELALGPSAIQALGTIAVAPSDLRRMDVYAIDALTRWVGNGGHLLVAADPGPVLPQLPAALQPGSRRLIGVGDGDVRMAGSDLGTGSWDSIVEPTPVGSRRSGRVAFGRGGVSTSLSDELQSDSGFVVPRLRWLVPGVVGYGVTLVGVIVLLRRRLRPFSHWLALPVVGVLVAGVVLLLSADVRGRVNPAQATILDATPSGTEATTFVGVTKGRPGRVTARFDPRWIMDTLPSEALASTLSSFATLPVKVAREPGALAASVDVNVGTSGLIGARGPVESRGALVVTARAEGDERVAGTIRNTTPWRLDSVAVMVATGSVLVGSLEPDEQRDWTLFVPDLNGRADRALGSDVWPVGNFSGVASIVNFPAWWAWASTRTDELAAPGRITAVGWTRGYAARVSLDGKPASRLPGRTAVVGRGVVKVDDAAPRRSSVRRTILRGDALSAEAGLARFDVASDSAHPALTARVVAGTRLEAWVGGRWLTIQEPDGSGPSSSGASVAADAGDTTADAGDTTGGAADGDDGAADAALAGNGVAGGGVVVSALLWNEVPVPPAAVIDGRVHLRIIGTLTDPSAPTPVELLTVGAPTPAPVGT